MVKHDKTGDGFHFTYLKYSAATKHTVMRLLYTAYNISIGWA